MILGLIFGLVPDHGQKQRFKQTVEGKRITKLNRKKEREEGGKKTKGKTCKVKRIQLEDKSICSKTNASCLDFLLRFPSKVPVEN